MNSALAIAKEAIRRCHATELTRAAVPELRAAHAVHLAGAGKAAGQMAVGVVEALGHVEDGALVVTKEGAFDGFASPGMTVRFAGHPSPDERSEAAARDLIKWLSRRTVTDLVVFVLSGGASSLLAAPVPGVSREDLARTNDALLAAGIAIDDVNRVRRELARTAAGRLAAACRSRVEVLVLSDVVSGDLAHVGSGPFHPTPDEREDLLAVVDRVDVPPKVRGLLRGARRAHAPPSHDHPLFARVRHTVVGSPTTLVNAAKEAAGGAFRSAYGPNTDDVGVICERFLSDARSSSSGGVYISGGEPTVVVPADSGPGGRNTHLALAMARAIAGTPYQFAALGSDGDDGTTGAAGAAVDGTTWSALGEPEDALVRGRAFPVMKPYLVRLPPTGTNLCDLHILVVP